MRKLRPIGRLEHTGSDDCPACAAIQAMNHAIVDVLTHPDYADLDDVDKIQGLLGTTAAGIVSSSAAGKVHLNLATAINILIDRTTEAVDQAGRTSTELIGVNASLANRRASSHASTDNDIDDLSMLHLAPSSNRLN